MPLERRFSPITIDGRTLKGAVMPYGETAFIPGIGLERFEPGSLVFDDVILNVQHDRNRPIARTDGGLELVDDATALRMVAQIADTRDGLDALANVKNRILRGLSVEFDALDEFRDRNIRIIKRALLNGIGLVDRPAYEGAIVHTRARGYTYKVQSQIPTKKKLACDCVKYEKGDYVYFRNSAALRKGAEGYKEILLVNRNYSKPLASKKRGTLDLNATDEGLQITANIPEELAAPVVAQATAVPIYARPLLDESKSDMELDGDTVYFNHAEIRAILLGTTDRADGWNPITIERNEQQRREYEQRQRLYRAMYL